MKLLRVTSVHNSWNDLASRFIPLSLSSYTTVVYEAVTTVTRGYEAYLFYTIVKE